MDNKHHIETWKRIINISKKNGYEFNPENQASVPDPLGLDYDIGYIYEVCLHWYAIDRSKLTETAEKELYTLLQHPIKDMSMKQVHTEMDSYVNLEYFSTLTFHIKKFLRDCMVENNLNRIAICNYITFILYQYADFTKINHHV